MGKVSEEILIAAPLAEVWDFYFQEDDVGWVGRSVREG